MDTNTPKQNEEFVKAVRQFIYDLREEVRKIDSERRELKKLYEGKLKELDERLKNVQSRCPHLSTEHHPDASGNNASWNECELCGKYLR